jgi:phage gpG-like protein
MPLGFEVEGSPQLDRLIQSLTKGLDTQSILDEGAAVIFNRIRTRFIQELSPSGERWPPSKASEHRAKVGAGGGILFATGKMFRSLQLYSVDDNTRAIGTNAESDLGFPYPLAMQFGWGHNISRVFVGFAEEDRQFMSDLVVKRIGDWLNK